MDDDDEARTELSENLVGLRVAIVGAGLGGLCLAQGLKRAGADVVVYERDGALDSRRQGYRLHIDARAGIALQRCLSPGLFALFLAACGQPSLDFTVMTERLRIVHEIRNQAAGGPLTARTLSTSANRQTLREILALDLDEELHFDKELAGYREGSDVTLTFADGTHAVADLLFGADGVSSVVRRQRLPHAQVFDTGGRCLYGKTMLDRSATALVPAPLKRGFTAIVGGHIAMATGLVQLRERPEIADARLSPCGDYLMWALCGTLDAFGTSDSALASLTAPEVHALATKVMRGWHPDLRVLVARAAVEQTFAVRVRTAAPVGPWTPSRVTLLGDAIHAMSPARGSGANTALQDAGVLCRLLTAARPDALGAAIGAYEQQMRAYGFAALQASQQAEAETAARRHRRPARLHRSPRGR